MYYLLYGILYTLSLLPWFVMHGISDLLSFLNWHLIGYRKDVVLGNLRIAFPEKTEEERRQIARAFYRNFMDMLVESLKVISMSEHSLQRKYQSNMQAIELMENLGDRVHLHAMHNFSWEIINHGIARDLKIPFMAVYMPISNPSLEGIFSKVRRRYGTILIPATAFKTNFTQYEQDRYALALVADQNPGSPGHAYWANFFGKPAPFVRGPERAARARHLPVVFGHFYPVRRGVYSFACEVVTTNAAEMSEGELTRAYVRFVESCIRKQPANYLWSHRRWKYAWKEEYAPLAIEPLKLDGSV
jgi:KDO2-lipid IV(A) lauroyltransferase